MKYLKKNLILIIAAIAYLTAFIFDHNLFIQAVTTCGMFLKEMLEIMPAVFIITGLLSIWIPRDTITKNLGRQSGLKGKIISLLVGSISAGPIYAAFPIGQSLLKKGISISNLVVIISSWAVVKIPMLIVEQKFMGIEFTITRYLLTIPCIFLIAFFTEKKVKEIKLDMHSDVSLKARIAALLPQNNCGVCGYANCMSYATAIIEEKTSADKCIPGRQETATRIIECLREYPKS